jgi:hypothetical protein
MRVHRILIALASLIANYTIAQNTYPWSASGNVGIGTTNPGAILHIVPAPTSDNGIQFNNAINGYSSLIWASNNVGFGLVAGGGLFAHANPGMGLSISNAVANSSAGAMLNVKGSGATSTSYTMKIQNSNSSDILTVRDDGNVGIGTAAPTAPLNVSTSAQTMSVFQNPGTGNSWVSVMNNTGYMNLGVGASTPHPYVWSSTNSFFIGSDGAPTLFVAGMGNGSVGIGTTTPKAKLAVNGDILAKKVTVSLNNLPDYVFNTNYSLRSLNEVEQYIQQHHHLPEVPSAEEVKKDGLNLGDNQATLLKKIEELTLYVIEMEKNQKQQQQEIQQLKKLLSEKSK